MDSAAISNSTALSLLDEGNTYLINRRYDAAVSSYSNAINSIVLRASNSSHDGTSGSGPNSNLDSNSNSKTSIDVLSDGIRFRILSHRAEAHLRLQNAPQAAADSKAALALVEKGGEEFRKVLIDGELDMIRMREKEAANMVQNFTKSSKETAAAPAPTPEPVTANVQTAEKSGVSNATTTRNNTTIKKAPTCPKYQYYQSDSVMTISILESNVQPENLKVDFSLDKISVIIKKGGVEFTVICGTLFDAVEVSKCKVVYKDEKVLIKLRKQEKFEWHNLFGSGAAKKKENDPKDVDKKSSSTSSAPKLDSSKKDNRPYASDKDWDAIDRNLREEEENDKPEGEEAVNHLFQNIEFYWFKF